MTPTELKRRAKALFGPDWMALLALNLSVTRKCVEAMRNGKRKKIRPYVIDKLVSIESGAFAAIMKRDKPKIGRPARKVA